MKKKTDTDLVAAMIEDSFQILTIGQDEMTLVYGDSDYVPGVEKLKKLGFPLHVVFWSHGSRELSIQTIAMILLLTKLQNDREKIVCIVSQQHNQPEDSCVEIGNKR